MVHVTRHNASHPGFTAAGSVDGTAAACVSAMSSPLIGADSMLQRLVQTSPQSALKSTGFEMGLVLLPCSKLPTKWRLLCRKD
eukprot:3811490-Amphidinium_carterae.1